MINSIPKISKPIRILSLFERFNKGEVVDKKKEAKRYNVSSKTIQRDIKEIRIYFSTIYHEVNTKIIYSEKENGYILKRDQYDWINSQEILGLSKILLESRAFSEKEMNVLIEKLIKQTVPDQRKHIKKIINNEYYHYYPPKHEELLLDKIWDLSQAVRKNKIVQFKYSKVNSSNFVNRKVTPLGLMFSEYYFYLIAQRIEDKYDYKIPYRLDRIKNYKVLEENFKVPYKERFKEGEFRKRVQFMTPGKLLKIKFKFWGRSIQAVLDRLPTAKIIKKQEKEVYIVEAEVYGQGIKMWLLSQGQYLEVLEPKEFRKEMKETVKKMYNNY